MKTVNKNEKCSTILVVEENKELNLLIQKRIQNIDMKVLDVFSGSQAIEKIENNHIDLILLDYQLPDMNVKEFILTLEKKNRHIPFIILAESSDAIIAVSMMKLGAREYIIKENNLLEILPTTVKRVLDELLVEKRLMQSEAAIIKGEMQLREIINANVDGMVIVDKKGLIRFVNPAAEKLFKRKKETLDGEAFGFPLVVGENTEIQIHAKASEPKTVEMRVNAIEWTGSECFLASLRDITERKLAEEKIREQRDRAQNYLDIADVIILALDTEGKIILINNKGCEILGDKKENIMGKNWFDHFLPASDRDKEKEVFRAIISGDQKTYKFYENNVTTKKGGLKIINWHNKLIRDAKEKIIGILSSGEDITENRQSEKRQLLSAEVLRLLNEARIKENIIRKLIKLIKEFTTVEAIGIRLRQGEDYPYYVVNGFTEDFVNQGQRLCTYDQSGELLKDVHGKPLLECMCGRVISGKIDLKMKRFTHFGSFWSNNLEQDIKLLNGERQKYFSKDNCHKFDYKSMTLIPLRSDEEILGLLQLNSTQKNHFTLDQINFLESIASSIGIAIERIRTQEALQESREQFKQFFENEPNYCYMISPQATIIDVNRAALMALGYEKEELIGKSVHVIYAPEYHKKTDELFTRWLNTGIIKNEELEIITKTGEKRAVLLNASAVKDNKGKVLHSVSVQTDITEKRHLQQQLLQSQKMEAIGTLAGGVAHDFNNILSIIINYAQFLMDNIDPKTQAYLDCKEIAKAAEKAADLTRQLLAFSRKQVLQSRPVNINNMIKDLGKMLYRLIGEDIRLISDLDVTDPFIKVDPGQMEQVIMNLVVNARDAMFEGGKSTIKTEKILVETRNNEHMADIKPGSYVCISISDTGVGIRPDIIHKIFDPFFTTKRMGKGSGLGLSVVYGIIRQHGGNITVSSELGKGTTFKIYLPECAIKIGEEKKKHIPLKNFYGKGEKILVVEDDKTILGYLKRALTAYGFNVVSASSARQALDLFERQGDDILFLFSDVVLPDISGLELAKKLAAKKPGLKIILSSGYLDEKSKGEDIQKCGFHFIQKPFKGKEVLNTIQAILSQSH